MALDYKTNSAAYSITHQIRHLFGPDAIFTSLSFGVVPLVVGFNASGGYINILYGSNVGKSPRYRTNPFVWYVDKTNFLYLQ